MCAEEINRPVGAASSRLMIPVVRVPAASEAVVMRNSPPLRVVLFVSAASDPAFTLVVSGLTHSFSSCFDQVHLLSRALAIEREGRTFQSQVLSSAPVVLAKTLLREEEEEGASK